MKKLLFLGLLVLPQLYGDILADVGEGRGGGVGESVGELVGLDEGEGECVQHTGFSKKMRDSVARMGLMLSRLIAGRDVGVTET